MDAKVHQVLGELRRRLEDLYGGRLVKLVLFGSQARGDAEPGSDIDVMVVLRGPVRPGEEIARASECVAELSLRFNEVVSCVFMDEQRFISRNGPLVRNIRKEGVTV